MSNVITRTEEIWRGTGREGVEDLLQFFKESDYYNAPCSVKNHLNCKGGLAQHTLNVHDIALRNWPNTPSVIVATMGHDIGKIYRYKEGDEPCSESQRNYLTTLTGKAPVTAWGQLSRKDMHLPSYRPSKSYASALINWLKTNPDGLMPQDTTGSSWSISDALPIGHAEKSLVYLARYIKLTDEEILAIRWHMGLAGVQDYELRKTYEEACQKTTLIAMVQIADYQASAIVEREVTE